MGTRTRQWLGLGLLAVLLVLGTHLVWARPGAGAGSGATVTYAWVHVELGRAGVTLELLWAEDQQAVVDGGTAMRFAG